MSQSNVDDFERIVGKNFFVDEYYFKCLFFTFYGQMFVVEEEDFEKPTK